MKITVDLPPEHERKLRELVAEWSVDSNSDSPFQIEASFQLGVGINQSWELLQQKKARAGQ